MSADLAARVAEALDPDAPLSRGATVVILADTWAEVQRLQAVKAFAARDEAKRQEAEARATQAEAERDAALTEARRLVREAHLATTQAEAAYLDLSRDTLAGLAKLEAERDEARAAVQAACDAAVVEAVRAIERARDEAEADARRLRAALEGLVKAYDARAVDGDGVDWETDPMAGAAWRAALDTLAGKP